MQAGPSSSSSPLHVSLQVGGGEGAPGHGVLGPRDEEPGPSLVPEHRATRLSAGQNQIVCQPSVPEEEPNEHVDLYNNVVPDP